MTQELPDQITKISVQDMLYSLALAWYELFSAYPSKESLLVLLAQTSLETGQYKSVHCWNFGNIKGAENDGFDYTFFKCNELVKLQTAKNMVNSSIKDGGFAQITGVRPDGFAWIWFYPKNKYCRFRAFSSANEGCVMYLSFLKKKYSKSPAVWNSILQGDPAGFCHYLKLNNYYTADETIYTRGVVNLFNQFKKLEYDLEKLPIFSEDEKEKILTLVQLTNGASIEEELKHNKPEDT